MTDRHALPWDNAPSYTTEVVDAHNAVLAMRAEAGVPRWFNVNGLCFTLNANAPMSRYPLVITLAGTPGELVVGIEMTAIYPEYSETILRAASRAKSTLHRLVDWIAMPWIDTFESMLGCALALKAVALDQPMPDRCVSFSILSDEGRTGHIAAVGTLLKPFMAARTWRPTQAALPPINVRLTWVIRVAALSFEEMDRLGRGALVLLDPADLYLYIGHMQRNLRMKSQWDQDHAIISGERDGESQQERATTQNGDRLVPLTELTFDVDVILETRALPWRDISELRKNAIFRLDRPADGRMVALACDGRIFARGEIVQVDGQLAVLITECQASDA